jgi:hypothetical protein
VVKTGTVKPVAIIIEVAMMVHSRVPSIVEVALMVHSRVPSEVPTTTKMRTITYMMIEIVWVSMMRAVISEKGLPVVVISVIMDMIVGSTPKVPGTT